MQISYKYVNNDMSPQIVGHLSLLTMVCIMPVAALLFVLSTLFRISTGLTHLPLVPHICAGELVHH